MTLRKRLFLLLLVVITALSCVVPAYADVSAADAYNNLKKAIVTGNLYKAKPKQNSWGTLNQDYTLIRKNQYKLSGGGYVTYSELTEYEKKKGDSTKNIADTRGSGDLFNVTMYNDLTSGEKQEFLKDILRVANSCSYYDVKGITDETVTDLYNELQDYSGMGSQLMASLLAETKPDYATANRIYQPFSGVVGTILGFLSVIVMALLGVTMALDICYIQIPAFQLIIGAEKDGSGGGSGATKFAAKIISTEAQKAVQVSQNDGQNGEFKSAIGVYFKYRWKGLVILGICLLYLVGGHIWSFVAWFIDLLSGFLGF